MSEIHEHFKILKEKLGITAWEEITRFWASLDIKIEDLTKSREKWKRRARVAESQLKEPHLKT